MNTIPCNDHCHNNNSKHFIHMKGTNNETKDIENSHTNTQLKHYKYRNDEKQTTSEPEKLKRNNQVRVRELGPIQRELRTFIRATR